MRKLLAFSFEILLSRQHGTGPGHHNTRQPSRAWVTAVYSRAACPRRNNSLLPSLPCSRGYWSNRKNVSQRHARHLPCTRSRRAATADRYGRYAVELVLSIAAASLQTQPYTQRNTAFVRRTVKVCRAAPYTQRMFFATALPKRKQRAQLPRVRKKWSLSLSTCESESRPTHFASLLVPVLNLPFWGALANSPFQRQCRRCHIPSCTWRRCATTGRRRSSSSTAKRPMTCTYGATCRSRSATAIWIPFLWTSETQEGGRLSWLLPRTGTWKCAGNSSCLLMLSKLLRPIIFHLSYSSFTCNTRRSPRQSACCLIHLKQSAMYVRRVLVERQADVSAKKNFKCTALHLAAHGGHKSVVELLVQCKAGTQRQIFRGKSRSSLCPLFKMFRHYCSQLPLTLSHVHRRHGRKTR